MLLTNDLIMQARYRHLLYRGIARQLRRPQIHTSQHLNRTALSSQEDGRKFMSAYHEFTRPVHLRFLSDSASAARSDHLLHLVTPILAQGNVESLEQAHSLVVTAKANDGFTDSLEQARLAVFDAWMRYFEQLTDAYNKSVPPDTLDDLLRVRAVEQARVMLELLLPVLKHNKHGLSDFLIQSMNVTDLELSGQTSEYRHNANLPLSQRCNALLRAFGTLARIGHDKSQGKHLHAIPQRAQYILEQMEATLIASSTDEHDGRVILKPTVEAYNAVLEAWAFSQEHLRGNMAEQIFQKIPRTNGESFRLVIRAWCRSRDRRAAFHATGHLMKMLRRREHGEEDFEPSLEDYHLLLKAWETAEDRTSPSKAQSILRLMEQALAKEITTIHPDLACYRSVLNTAAQRPNFSELGRMVDDILTKMKAQIIIPDAACYTAAIRTWRNCALHPDNFEHRELAVRRSLELLADMNVANLQSTQLSVRPSTTNINDVLEALSASKHPERTNQAEQLLESLEDGYDKALESLRPNADSYRFTINIWGTTSLVERVPRARAIIWRMMEQYETLRTYNKTHDIVEVFNAFIRICGSVRVEGEDVGLSVFKEALSSIENMKGLDGLQPNSSTYAALLETSKSLLPLGKQRQRVVDEVFRLCVEDGMVDEHVLKMLRLATTVEQYTKLVINRSEDAEGIKIVPEPWTVNVLGGRVLNAVGRRTTPLTIDGQLTETLAMKEFQMRRLSDKRNRNLLQGGRLRASPLDRHVTS
ncbi:hypothetical protein MPSEU_000375700 [Mayamaea pseudoterrestris]|nr:hypothetical protein MPSEU_000375700 [Mayamaea pseudoterrestris]